MADRLAHRSSIAGGGAARSGSMQFHDHRAALAIYGAPSRVLARVGVVER